MVRNRSQGLWTRVGSPQSESLYINASHTEVRPYIESRKRGHISDPDIREVG